MIYVGKMLDKSKALDGGVSGHSPAGLEQGVLRRVVDRDAQSHPGAVRRCPLAMLDRPAQVRGQSISATDDVYLNGLFQAALRLRGQVAVQKSEQGAYLGLGPGPVGRRECVKSQDLNALARSRFDYRVDGLGPGTMAGCAR